MATDMPDYCKIEIQYNLGGPWHTDHSGVRLVDPQKYAQTLRARHPFARVRVTDLDDGTEYESASDAALAAEELI